MNDTTKLNLLSGTDLVSISLKARDLADSAIIAYWVESYGRDIAFHRRGALGSLHALADLCGFDLVERGTDTLEDAAVDVLLGDRSL